MTSTCGTLASGRAAEPAAGVEQQQQRPGQWQAAQAGWGGLTSTVDAVEATLSGVADQLMAPILTRCGAANAAATTRGSSILAAAGSPCFTRRLADSHSWT